MVAEQQKTEVLRRETTDVKGKLVEFAWWMKKRRLQRRNHSRQIQTTAHSRDEKQTSMKRNP